MEQQKNRFRVNFKGILDILSKHLYSSEEVFLRELLQNAKDAVTLRKLKDDSFIQGVVNVEVMPAGERSVLIFEDNGNGLTLDEVEAFLSVIGSSSKKDISDLQMNDQTFVGQFGIGLLSCFMISDKITLLSRSASADKAVKWEATIDGTYAAKELEESSIQVGTKIFLEIDPEKQDTYTPEKIKRLLTKYSQFLGMEVSFTKGKSKELVERKFFPWENADTLNGDAVLEFGRQYFDIDFQHQIPLKSTDGKTQGVGFIYPFSSKPGSQPAHHVYVKNMLIDEMCADILPDWAFFIKAVVNSETLRPTASREGIYKDKVLELTRQDLEQSIRDYFEKLAKTAPSILEQIITTHQLAIKAFAVSDPSFFDLVIDFLTFPTSQGQVKVKDLRGYDDVQYVIDLDQFRQILPLAKANNQMVVNTGYIYDTTLMKKLQQKFPEKFTVLDDFRFSGILEDVDWDEDNAFSSFRDRCNDVLDQFNCEVLLKKFAPPTLPAIFHLSSDQAFSRDIDRTKSMTNELWGGMLSELTSAKTGYQQASNLFVNVDNLLIQKIIKIDSDEKFQRCVELIYVNSLLLGHYALNEQESKLLNENLIAIIDLSI